MKSKRVLIVLPNLGMGGIQTAGVNVAQMLSSYFEITIMTIFNVTPFYQLSSNIKVLNNAANGDNKKLNLIQSILNIRASIKEIQPHNVIVFNKLYAAITTVAASYLDCRVIISERSSPFYKWDYKTEIFSKLVFTLKPPDIVICQTDIAKRIHLKKYKKSEVRLIPNVVKKITEDKSQQPRKKILLCAGRFNDACKGFDLMIKAFNILKNTDWELCFAGGTPDEGKYLLKFASIQSLNRIKFLGKVNNINQLFFNAGIFIMPSRSEGFPNALAEALACGVPCISFNFVSGAADLIQNNFNGILVPPEDINELAKQIDLLINNHELRQKFSENARKSVIKFGETNIIQEYFKILL